MEVMSSTLSRAVNYLTTIKGPDFIDIIIVAYLIFRAFWFVRKTNSHNLAKGLVVVLLTLWLSQLFGLTMINFLLRKAVELGFIAILILFQPELRRILERMGSRLFSNRADAGTAVDTAITQIVLASKDMSDSRTGALVVFERDVSLNNAMSTGTIINADVTAELLKNIFFNKAPLHDGAVIIRDGRIAAAGCVLPLTQSTNLSKDLGMRHRAGIGLSEQSDALIVIVSEETGAISLASDGMLKRHLTPAMLDKLLRSQLIPEKNEKNNQNLGFYLKKLVRGTMNEEEKRDENNI